MVTCSCDREHQLQSRAAPKLCLALMIALISEDEGDKSNCESNQGRRDSWNVRGRGHFVFESEGMLGLFSQTYGLQQRQSQKAKAKVFSLSIDSNRVHNSRLLVVPKNFCSDSTTENELHEEANSRILKANVVSGGIWVSEEEGCVCAVESEKCGFKS